MPLTKFSTDQLSAHEQASFWREVATKAFVEHEFTSQSGRAFRGEIEAGLLGPLAVARFACEACTVTRSRKQAAHDGHDAILLNIFANGQGQFIQKGDRHARGEVGGVALVDTRQEFSETYDTDTSSTIVSIPRAALEARLHINADFASFEFDTSNPLTRIIASIASELPAAVCHLSEATAFQVANHFLDLVATVYAAASESQPHALDAPRKVSLARLKGHIEAMLPDSELTPDKAAAAARMSVRYANLLMAEEGTTVERYIFARRLERCRQALENAGQLSRPISDIALGWGFASVPHFNRRFKAQYGMPPGDYRQTFHLGLRGKDRDG